MAHHQLLLGSDNNVVIRRTKDGATEATVSGGTGTAQVYSDADMTSSLGGPYTISEEGSAPSDEAVVYTGEIPDSLAGVSEGDTVYVKVTLTAGGKTRVWRLKTDVIYGAV